MSSSCVCRKCSRPVDCGAILCDLCEDVWVCKSCGEKGGFKCYGVGHVVCGICGRLHLVGPDGQLHLTHIIREYREEETDEGVEIYD